MIKDTFKNRYTTIPFAYHKQYSKGNGYTIISHQHKELELIAMVEGEIAYYMDSVKYELKPGDVMVVPPYCVHRAVMKAGAYYDCICFDLSLIWDEELIHGLEQGALTVKGKLDGEASGTSVLHSFVRNAVNTCEENLPGWELGAIGNLSILFGALKREGYFIKSKKVAIEHRFGKAALEYVTEHFAEPISSGTASEVMYLNNSYFCRMFKKTFGCCFAEYLMEFRVEKAKFYLNNSKKSVSEIALITGFSSFSYFCRAFKNTVGMSPSAYRRRHKPSNEEKSTRVAAGTSE